MPTWKITGIAQDGIEACFGQPFPGRAPKIAEFVARRTEEHIELEAQSLKPMAETEVGSLMFRTARRETCITSERSHVFQGQRNAPTPTSLRA